MWKQTRRQRAHAAPAAERRNFPALQRQSSRHRRQRAAGADALQLRFRIWRLHARSLRTPAARRHRRRRDALHPPRRSGDRVADRGFHPQRLAKQTADEPRILRRRNVGTDCRRRSARPKRPRMARAAGDKINQMDPVFTLQWPEFLLANRLQKLLPKKDGYSVLIPTSRQEKGIDLAVLKKSNGQN